MYEGGCRQQASNGLLRGCPDSGEVTFVAQGLDWRRERNTPSVTLSLEQSASLGATGPEPTDVTFRVAEVAPFIPPGGESHGV